MKAQPATKKANDAEAVVPGSDNVFADLGFPEKEASDLKVKAQLTFQIHQRIKELGLTQTSTALRLDLSQPDVSKLMAGRHTGYSMARLLTLLNALEVDIDIVIRPKLRGRHPHRGVVRILEASSRP